MKNKIYKIKKILRNWKFKILKRIYLVLMTQIQIEKIYIFKQIYIILNTHSYFYFHSNLIDEIYFYIMKLPSLLFRYQLHYLNKNITACIL